MSSNDEQLDGSGSSDDGLSVGAVKRIAEQVVRGLVPKTVRNIGPEAKKLLTNPFTYIITTVIAWVEGSILRPFIRSLLDAGVALVGAVLAFFTGIAEVITLGGITATNDVDALASPVVGFAENINTAIANIVAQSGPAAPAVAALLYGGLMLGTLYGMWVLARSILGGRIEIVTGSIRKLLEVTR